MSDLTPTDPPPAGTPRFCRTCGQPLAPGAEFCGNCGTPVSQPPPPFVPPSQWKRGTPINLAPMRVGQLLDAAIKLYRLNWKTFMGIAAFVVVPLAFVQAFLLRSFETGLFPSAEQSISESDALRAFVIGGVFALFQLLVVTPFLVAAFARAAADTYLGGQPTVQDTYRFALGRILSILLVSFLTGLAVVGGFILLIIPGIIFAIRFTFGSTVVVVENKRGREAMTRSWRLAKGYFWKIAGTLFLAGILRSVVGAIFQLPFGAAAGALGHNGWFLTATGGSLAAILTQPFAAIIAVLLYFDLRIRKEGFDIALMAAEIAGTGET